MRRMIKKWIKGRWKEVLKSKNHFEIPPPKKWRLPHRERSELAWRPHKKGTVQRRSSTERPSRWVQVEAAHALNGEKFGYCMIQTGRSQILSCQRFRVFHCLSSIRCTSWWAVPDSDRMSGPKSPNSCFKPFCRTNFLMSKGFQLKRSTPFFTQH